ncbi:uncharacterized protein LOC143257171 [Tachypleus tridentatus]|uniref:uncharacterized protein LOC143257171 n=1 Tax=Tachypleus tridentatus TaxID=6853 RepID=UPI003FD4FA53
MQVYLTNTNNKMDGNVPASLLFLVSLCLVSSWGIHSSIFAITQRNMRGLTTAVLTTIHSTANYCANECIKYPQCNSFALSPKNTDGSRMQSCDLLSSENISDITPSSGWNIFSTKPFFLNEVLKATGNTSINSAWLVDCNYDQSGFVNGVLVGMWDATFDFADIDNVKCTQFNFGSIALVDTTKTVVKDTVTDSDCPPNHVVTALWDDNIRFRTTDYQKCTPLTSAWSVDTASCEQKVSGPELGDGSNEAEFTWKFQCARSEDKFTAVVGVFRISKQLRITCCNLLQNF